MEKVRENALSLLANMVIKFCDMKSSTPEVKLEKGHNPVITFF